MTKIPKFQTNSIRIRGFEFSPILDLIGRLFVSKFEFRIWEFEFCFSLWFGYQQKHAGGRLVVTVVVCTTVIVAAQS